MRPAPESPSAKAFTRPSQFLDFIGIFVIFATVQEAIFSQQERFETVLQANLDIDTAYFSLG